MATELLNQRIKDVMCMRAKQGFQDPTPTLVDIEKTHILNTKGMNRSHKSAI